MKEKKSPVQEKDKKHVQQMFDDIAHDYDKLNHLLTLGIDKSWRKKLVKKVLPLKEKSIIDIATGTGDLAFEFLKHSPKKVVGVDFSHEMVEVCKKKIVQRKHDDIFLCVQADALALPFEPQSFHIASIGFGIRNFQSPQTALKEIYRVLKQEGEIIVIEFFSTSLIKKRGAYRLYMKNIMPLIGNAVSGHSYAYKYLFESIEQFVTVEEFVQMLQAVGFTNIEQRKLMGGMAHIIYAKKMIQ
jgi:demethylmenaquinone methyltransferase / 2-methoxy-6-polyprenyl-1,4-benzoquinol methylase